jgi:hypothetical protein
VISENDWCNFTAKNATRNSEAHGQASLWRSVVRSRDVSLPSLLNSQNKTLLQNWGQKLRHQEDYFRNRHDGGFPKDRMVQHTCV